jgi:signal peptidase II
VFDPIIESRSPMVGLESMLAAAGVLVADQVSKALAGSRKSSQKSTQERPFLSIQYVRNRRGALASFVGTPALLGTWAICIALAALMLLHGMPDSGMLGPIGIGVALGGATGNLFDRLWRGATVDFIALGWWPVFNLADAAIVSGVGLVLLSMLTGHA